MNSRLVLRVIGFIYMVICVALLIYFSPLGSPPPPPVSPSHPVTFHYPNFFLKLGMLVGLAGLVGSLGFLLLKKWSYYILLTQSVVLSVFLFFCALYEIVGLDFTSRVPVMAGLGIIIFAFFVYFSINRKFLFKEFFV